MRNYVSMPIEIWDYDNSTFAVAFYLLSIPYNRIIVKQSTIAKKCGLCTKTVARAINNLIRVGFIKSKSRTRKNDKNYGINEYHIADIVRKAQKRNKDIALVSTKIFDKGLRPLELKVYTCLVNAQGLTREYSWNSYNDIAKKINISRNSVINAIKNIYAKKIIKKIRKYRKTNRKVYADNRYSLVNNFKMIRRSSPLLRLYLYITTSVLLCQDAVRNYGLFFYDNRGSPKFSYHYITQRAYDRKEENIAVVQIACKNTYTRIKNKIAYLWMQPIVISRIGCFSFLKKIKIYN